MMDGMTKAYEVTKDEELKKAIEKIIGNFLTIDYINLECQTHATLSCARGILRFYNLTQDKKYLDIVEKIFKNYVSLGMTYDYSNINWFKREDTWTEPCCVIDSMILTKELYLITKENKYLDMFNRIYENSIRTFQRNNGGAGCSTCATHTHYEMKMFLYEAYFCCTMRLGDGFGNIADFAVIKNKDNYIVPFACAVSYEDEECSFDVDAEFYETHKITIDVNKTANKTLLIRLPKNACVEGLEKNDGFVIISLLNKGKIELNIKINVIDENSLKFYGDMLLTRKEENIEPSFLINNKVYSYIYDSSKYSEEELKKKVQYVR